MSSEATTIPQTETYTIEKIYDIAKARQNEFVRLNEDGKQESVEINLVIGYICKNHKLIQGSDVEQKVIIFGKGKDGDGEVIVSRGEWTFTIHCFKKQKDAYVKYIMFRDPRNSQKLETYIRCIKKELLAAE
jgi:hypothetical protein